MSQSFKRLNCVICDSNYLVNFINVKMPVYLGQTEDRSQFNFNDYLLAECTNCGEVQLSELVRPEIVYQKSHNSEVVGRTWTEHFSEFSNFIGDLKDKVILEIGDPSKKLTKFKKKFSQWLIVDPNVDKNDEEENIVLLNSFFDENFEIQQKVDIILHSHFFEHTINPSIFLKKCFEVLPENGEMYFSIPNLPYLLENGFNPSNILHFEHTFFYDSKILEHILIKSGFEVVDIQPYKNHSLFYKVRKSDINKNSKIEKRDFRSIFLSNYESQLENIHIINDYIRTNKNLNFFLFGCNVASQFLICNGLDVKNINCILDNATQKHKKYLYGTHLLCNSTDELNHYDNICVITSHMSVYETEIRNSLSKLKNKKLKFI